MVPIPPAEPLEINTFKTIARLPFLQTQMNISIASTHNPCTVNQLQLSKTQTVHLKIIMYTPTTSPLLSYSNSA